MDKGLAAVVFFVVLFSLLGYWLFRGPGLLFGGLIGYLLSNALPTLIGRGLVELQSQFFDSTFAVMGAVCKADGVVTPDEIRAAEQLFIRLHLSDEQQSRAKAAFQRGKDSGFDLDAEVARFARNARGNLGLLNMFLQAQLLAITADGEIHPKEHDMLLRIARGLGLSARDIAQLEALLRATSQQTRASSRSQPAPSRKQRLEDAYAVLMVAPEATGQEIKRAYRRLIAENHPDKLAAKGLPESMRELAEERTRTINAAYELLKKEKGFA